MKSVAKRVLIAQRLAETATPRAAVEQVGARYIVGEEPSAVGMATGTAGIGGVLRARQLQQRMQTKRKKTACARCCKRLVHGPTGRDLLDDAGQSSEAAMLQTKLEAQATREVETTHTHGVSVFGDDHELAMRTDVLDNLVIKREAIEHDLSLRIVAKNDIFSGIFYVLFFLLFFWVVMDQMHVRVRYEVEAGMLGYVTQSFDCCGQGAAFDDIASVEDIWHWLEGGARGTTSGRRWLDRSGC